MPLFVPIEANSGNVYECFYQWFAVCTQAEKGPDHWARLYSYFLPTLNPAGTMRTHGEVDWGWKGVKNYTICRRSKQMISDSNTESTFLNVIISLRITCFVEN